VKFVVQILLKQSSLNWLWC